MRHTRNNPTPAATHPKRDDLALVNRLARRPKRQPTQTRRAFTLIELLVVIAIIALLVSILLPSLQRAKDLAKVAICVSNMRNTAPAIQMYTSENQQAYPMCIMNGPDYYRGWDRLISPYIVGEMVAWGDDLPILRCPADVVPRWAIGRSYAMAGWYEKGTPRRWYDYGGYKPRDPALRTTTVEAPSGTLILAEKPCNNAIVARPWEDSTMVVSPNNQWENQNLYDHAGNIHNDKFTYMYLDMSVQHIPPIETLGGSYSGSAEDAMYVSNTHFSTGYGGAWTMTTDDN